MDVELLLSEEYQTQLASLSMQLKSISSQKANETEQFKEVYVKHKKRLAELDTQAKEAQTTFETWAKDADAARKAKITKYPEK